LILFSFFPTKHTEKHLHCDLSLSSSSIKIQYQLVHIDSVGSLQCAQSLFGITFGIGTRNRPLNKGEKVVTLHHGDAINLVDIPVVNGGAAINWIEEFVSTPGIDFIYEMSARVLKIKVRYNRFLAQEDHVAAALNLNGVELPARFDAGNNPMITLGTLFFIQRVNCDKR
jgi:hypothetical protein